MWRLRLANSPCQIYKRQMLNIFRALSLSKLRRSWQITKIWLSLLIVIQLILKVNQSTLSQTKYWPRHCHGKTPALVKVEISITKAEAKPLLRLPKLTHLFSRKRAKIKIQVRSNATIISRQTVPLINVPKSQKQMSVIAISLLIIMTSKKDTSKLQDLQNPTSELIIKPLKLLLKLFIQYPVQFKKKFVYSLIDLGNKGNAMSP